ncbi:MAG: chorismate mutase [Deltaproteobacteria bacterium]
MTLRTPDAPAGLTELRARIDAVDAQLVALLAARRAVVAELFAWKAAQGMPRLDTSREESIIADRVARGEALGVPRALTAAVIRAALDDSHAR